MSEDGEKEGGDDDDPETPLTKKVINLCVCVCACVCVCVCVCVCKCVCVCV